MWIYFSLKNKISGKHVIVVVCLLFFNRKSLFNLMMFSSLPKKTIHWKFRTFVRVGRSPVESFYWVVVTAFFLETYGLKTSICAFCICKCDREPWEFSFMICLTISRLKAAVRWDLPWFQQSIRVLFKKKLVFANGFVNHFKWLMLNDVGWLYSVSSWSEW